MIFNITYGGENLNKPPAIILDGNPLSVTMEDAKNWYVKITDVGSHNLVFSKLNSAKKGIDVFLLGGGYNGGNSWGEREGDYRGSVSGGGGNGGKYVVANNVTISNRTNTIVVGSTAGASIAFNKTSEDGSYSGVGGQGVEVYGYTDANGKNGTGGITPWDNNIYGTYGGGGGSGGAARWNIASGGTGAVNGGNGGADSYNGNNAKGIGGGGGGAGVRFNYTHTGGTGGTGIIIIRNHR